MLIRFSVVSFVLPNGRLGVVGSPQELGGWNALLAVPLAPVKPPKTCGVPTLWTVVVDIPEEDFEYKFVLWEEAVGCQFSQLDYEPRTAAADELDVPSCTLKVLNEYRTFPKSLESVRWEGIGDAENRNFKMTGAQTILKSLSQEKRAEITHAGILSHFYDPDMNFVEERRDFHVAVVSVSGDQISHRLATAPQSVYCLPTTTFAHDLSEFQQTTQYYNALREDSAIDFNKVLERVYVGTCPRQLKHFELLKHDLKISTIMNFQSEEDAAENWPDCANFSFNQRTPENLIKLVGRQGLNYVWTPTTDFNQDAKTHMIAQASWTLAGILSNPKTTGVYVHCNAGVGRSSACVAGFMINCLKVPIRQANLLMCMRRNMAYFDPVALTRGAADYEKKFGSQADLLGLSVWQPQAVKAPKKVENVKKDQAVHSTAQK